MKRFVIDPWKVAGPNTRFWEAAGSDLLFWETLRPEGQSLLDRMEQKKTCRYLRCHYTFSDIFKWNAQLGGQVYTEDEDGKPIYNFNTINKCFAEYVKRGIKPIVEYDFIPEKICYTSDNQVKELEEGLKVNLRGPADWNKWRELLRAFTQNLLDTFGLDEIRTWYFEVWNEPDGWPVEDLPTFFRMYDIFVDVVTSVDDKLRVGGPGCYSLYFLRDFLRHVAEGTNFVTGKKGTRVDFISYHIYGTQGVYAAEYPLVKPTILRFLQDILSIQRRLISKYPGLKDVEFHLNEWGVCSNWHRKVYDYPCLEFRNSEFSPLFLVKLVHCLYAAKDAFQFPISMLLYWGFAGEAAEDRLFQGMRELVTAGNLPKPIQTGFEMMSLLGEERLAVSGPKPGSNANILATRTGEKQIEFIIYHFDELDDEPEGEERQEVEISRLPENHLVEITGYILDHERHNTYRAWQQQGSPSTIDEADLASLKKVGELTPDISYTMNTNEGKLKLDIKMQKHSMRLYILKLK